MIRSDDDDDDDDDDSYTISKLFRSPRATMAWQPESSYIVPQSEKDSVPSSAEGPRLLGFWIKLTLIDIIQI